jgi:hypothetical protein
VVPKLIYLGYTVIGSIRGSSWKACILCFVTKILHTETDPRVDSHAVIVILFRARHASKAELLVIQFQPTKVDFHSNQNPGDHFQQSNTCRRQSMTMGLPANSALLIPLTLFPWITSANSSCTNTRSATRSASSFPHLRSWQAVQ